MMLRFPAICALMLLLPAGLLGSGPDEVRTVKLEDYPGRGPDVDTLRIGMFQSKLDDTSFYSELSLFSTDFFFNGSEYSVSLYENRPALIYKIWMQPGKSRAPLAVILPGIGGHYTSDSITAMADLLYSNGYSVLGISSAFNWEFMLSAGTVDVPGYTPEDSLDVYNALRAVLADVEKRNPGRIGRRVLVGMSLGALHTLFISDVEFIKFPEERLFDRYLAINTPVDLMYGMLEIDRMFSTWRKWDKRTLDIKLHKAAAVYLGMIERKVPVSMPLPVTSDEAKVLVGLNFRQILREVIYTIHRNRNMGIIKAKSSWFAREKLYREIEKYDFRKYIDVFMRKYYTPYFFGDFSLKEMNSKASLPSIEKTLAVNPAVRLMHNADDFLLRPKDWCFLESLFGRRLVLFDKGGHLGNLYVPTVRRYILILLAE